MSDCSFEPVTKLMRDQVLAECRLARAAMLKAKELLVKTNCWHLANDVCEDIYRLEDGL